jgi:hypothetical protein
MLPAVRRNSLAVVGVALILTASASSDSEPGGSGTGLFLLGLATLIPGAVLAPIGWARCGAKTPAVEVQPVAIAGPAAGARGADRKRARTRAGLPLLRF